MAIGNVGSYGTDAPIQGNPLGNAMAQVDESLFKRRAEQRAIDEKKKADEEAKRVKDDFDPKVELTGNQGINDLSIPFATQSARMYAQNVNRINNTKDLAEKDRLLQANNRIKQNFDNYSQLPKIVNSRMAEILKGVQEDKLNPRDAERASHLLDSLNNGKAKVAIDEYGVPRMTTYKVDSNGNLALDENGNPLVLERDQDLSAMVKSFQVHPNSQYDKALLENTDKFKLDTKTWEIGGNKYTREVKDKRTDDTALAFAKSIVSQPHERFELASRLNVPENDIPAMEQYVAKQFKDRIAQQKLQNHNYSYDTNARENKKIEPAKPTVVNADKVPLIEDVLHGKSETLNAKTYGIGKDTNFVTYKGGIPIENVGGEKTGINNLNVKAFTINKDNQIVFTGTVLDTKSSPKGGQLLKEGNEGAKYKRITRIATGETEAEIASKLGYDDVNQLKDYLHSVQPKQKTNDKDPLGLGLQ